MPPVRTPTKAKKKSPLPSKVCKLKKSKLTTPKGQKLKSELEVKKKRKKLELEVKKKKNKSLLEVKKKRKKSVLAVTEKKKKSELEVEKTSELEVKKKKKSELEVEKTSELEVKKKKKKSELEVEKQSELEVKKKSELEVKKKKKKSGLEVEKKSELEVKKKKKSELNIKKRRKKSKLSVRKKKKKPELEVEKEKKNKRKEETPSKTVKALKQRDQKVTTKIPKSPFKFLAEKQRVTSPQQKDKIANNERKRKDSESEVEIEIKKKTKINSPSKLSQTTKSRPQVEAEQEMLQTKSQDVSVKEMGTETTTKNICVTCLCCDMVVSEQNLQSHLFFGNIKCDFCLYQINKCTEFANIRQINSNCSRSPTGKHCSFQWDSCVTYVLNSLKRELAIRNFCKKIKDQLNIKNVCVEILKYLASLKYLEEEKPWNLAIIELKTYCEQILGQPQNIRNFNPDCLEIIRGAKYGRKLSAETKVCIEENQITRTKELDQEQSNSEADKDMQQNQVTESASLTKLGPPIVSSNVAGTSDNIKTESDQIIYPQQKKKLSKRNNQHQKVKRVDLRKIAQLPSDGRYLLVNYPEEKCPEECPECYSGFYPSSFTMNCSTCITRLECEVCGLVIFIVPG